MWIKFLYCFAVYVSWVPRRSSAGYWIFVDNCFFSSVNVEYSFLLYMSRESTCLLMIRYAFSSG